MSYTAIGIIIAVVLFFYVAIWCILSMAKEIDKHAKQEKKDIQALAEKLGRMRVNGGWE